MWSVNPKSDASGKDGSEANGWQLNLSSSRGLHQRASRAYQSPNDEVKQDLAKYIIVWRICAAVAMRSVIYFWVFFPLHILKCILPSQRLSMDILPPLTAVLSHIVEDMFQFILQKI